MDELGLATEHDMVLAFLWAEVDSPRWRELYASILQSVRVSRGIIDRPDLTRAEDNEQRIRVLARTRGYRVSKYLFTGFPCDTTTWRRVRLGPGDFGLLRYGNQSCAPGFFQLSGGTRRVVDAATNFPHVETDASPHVTGVVESLRAGKTYPPLIAVNSMAGDLILVEGYTRTTAYAVVGAFGPVDFLIGTSPHIQDWQFY
jgi:hypothetical protein